MLGENGTRVVSKTLLATPDFHIGVENPAPGVRPGQPHVRDYSGNRCLYDFDCEEFTDVPGSLARKLARDSRVARAIEMGKRYLGVA